VVMVRESQSSLPDAPLAVGDGQLRLKRGDLVAQSSVLGQQQHVALAKGGHAGAVLVGDVRSGVPEPFDLLADSGARS
jgi:hypothetical protein